MSLTAQEIIIGGTGRLYVGPENTPLPDSINELIPAPFSDVGYITDDGAKFTDEKTTNDVRPWQSFYPVRVHITERSAMLEVTLLQWNAATMEFAFGGGTFTEPAPHEYRYHPPAPESLAINALILDIADGDRNFRICVARGFVTSNTESTFAKTGPALLPVTFTVLANGDLDPWTIDSDDPAFATTPS